MKTKKQKARIEYEIENEKLKRALRSQKKAYREAIALIKEYQEAIIIEKQSVKPISIKPKKKKGKGEVVPFLIISDWHLSEIVKPSMVNGVNSFNDRIAVKRINRLWQNSLTLINIMARDVRINTLVVALLGDFFSGNIHEELLENNSMSLMDSVMFAQNSLVGGINFLLKNTTYDLVIPCSSGNHARVTKKNRITTEAGSSLEFYMYHNLANYFRSEKRVRFQISEGYHNYLRVFNKTIRFHHGHQIRYYGGVGGIYIPVNKAIARWNTIKKADLDVFGHFHQQRDDNRFICNGSLVGYNAYAVSIKAEYERPQQTFFLIDQKRGKTIVAPILLTQH